jgi:signal peptidase II
MKMYFVLPSLICAALVTIDQVAKYLSVQFLRPNGPIDLIPGVFQLSYVENDGASFGLFQGGRWIFVVLTFVVLAAIVIYFAKLPREKQFDSLRAALIFITAGAVGNLIDRLLNGYVVDMFYFVPIDFPVFNVADSCVVCGTILMLFLFLFKYKSISSVPATGADAKKDENNQ